MKAEASVLQLFQAIPPIAPAQAGQPGQVTAVLGNAVNTVARGRPGQHDRLIGPSDRPVRSAR
jgi:hypothetical protein